MTLSEELIEKLKDLNIPVIIIPIVESITPKSILKCSDETCCESCFCLDDSTNCICTALCPNCDCNAIVSDIPPVIDSNMLSSKSSKKLTAFVNKCNKGKSRDNCEDKYRGNRRDKCNSRNNKRDKKYGCSSSSSGSDRWRGWCSEQPSKKLTSKKLSKFLNQYKNKKRKGKKYGWSSDSCDSSDSSNSWGSGSWYGGHGGHGGHGGWHDGHRWHAKQPSKKLSSKKLEAFINEYNNRKFKSGGRRHRDRRHRDGWSSGSGSCHRWRAEEPSKKLTSKNLSTFINKCKKFNWSSDSCCSDDSWGCGSHHNHYNHHNHHDWYDHHSWHAREPSYKKKISKSLPSRKIIHKNVKKNNKKRYWNSNSSNDSCSSGHSWSSGSYHHWHYSPPKNAMKYKSNKKNIKLKAQFPVFERYIISFNNLDDDQTKNKMNDLKKMNGFKLKHSLMHTIKGCTATIDKQLAIELLMDPDIQYIEKDSIYSDLLYDKQDIVNMTAAPLWHQTITNTAPTPTDNFSTVHCYVMDTGIMANHAEFSSNQVFMSYNAISKSINAQDDNGHGTCVASLIGGNSVGISNKVILHSVKVLDSSGSGYVSDIIAGLNWIRRYKKPNAIVNMSFGGVYSKSLDYAIKQCILANIPIVCSSGNSGIDASNSSPANSSSVYTVSAYDSNKTKPLWSNFGPVVTTFAPGDSVKAAWNDSTASYYLVGGTSFACPIVSGIIARFLTVVPNATLLQITDFLNKSEINNEIINIGSSNTPNKRIVFNQANTVI